MITKIIHEEKIQKAKKYVEKGESFVIVTHVTLMVTLSVLLWGCTISLLLTVKTM